jgi:hypothetical protein
MEGLYFALSIFAVAFVIRWCLVAERGAAGEYAGLLAMRRPAADAKKPRRGDARRRGSYRG